MSCPFPFLTVHNADFPPFLPGASPRVRTVPSHTTHSNRATGCDACRARKVRCARENPDDPKTSCKHCIALNIPCTYDYQPKKRGPPNL